MIVVNDRSRPLLKTPVLNRVSRRERRICPVAITEARRGMASDRTTFLQTV